MIKTYDLQNLSENQQMHRKWIQPARVVGGSLAHWAFNKIEMYQRKIDLVDAGWSKSNFCNYYLSHILERVIAAAMPIFALLDAVRPSNHGLAIRLFNVQVPVRGSNCYKSLVLFLSSLALMPLAIYSPTTLYRTDDRWLNICNSSFLFTKKTLTDFEKRLNAIAESESTEKEGFAEEIYNMATQISSGVKIGQQGFSYQKSVRAFLEKGQIVLKQLKENNDEENSIQAIEKAGFALDLTSWLIDDPSVTNKLAANEIQHAFENNATELRLKNKCSSIPPCIGRLKNLKKLSLFDHNLKKLPPEIGQLTELQILTLSFNKLQSLPEEIGQLTQLRELNLLENKLESLPAGIRKLTQLEILHLTQNKLKILPAEIGQLTHLRNLSLRINELESLPKEIGMLTELQELDLTQNKLKSLPAEIGQFIHLQALYLNCNELESLPKEIGMLTELHELDLSHNKLKSVPAEIGQFIHLQVLYLHCNELKSLPAEIGQLAQLQHLSLIENELESLPAEIGQLAQLRQLLLSGNKLESLPTQIGQVAQLRWLHLSQNKLKSLPTEVGQLIQLFSFDISKNLNLAELPLSLGQIPNLTYIDINGTGIDGALRNAILAQCKALRDAEVKQIFPSRLNAWKVKGKSEVDLSELLKLDDNKILNINEWLLRLEKTCDFNSKSETGLAKCVCEMLADVVKHKSFQELFFAQVEANLESCQDRAAMALNEIYTLWKIILLPDDISLKEKLEIMASGAKMMALRAALAERIAKYQKAKKIILNEAVEIYLYYETTLKKKLNLLSAINEMAYSQMGKCKWIDEKSLIKEINNNYLNYLITFTSFEKIIGMDSDYNKAYDEKVQPIDKQIETLFENEPKSQGKLSVAYLNWQSELGRLNAKRGVAVSNLKKQWVKDRLE